MTTPDATSRLDTALSLEAARDLASMPYTPPEVILRHVGPLWRAYCAQLEALAAERAENARLRSSLASSLTLLGSLIEIHAKVVMDTDADRELHARVVQTFRDALDALAVAPRHEGSGEAT